LRRMGAWSSMIRIVGTASLVAKPRAEGKCDLGRMAAVVSRG
jgi:hypothetical protein